VAVSASNIFSEVASTKCFFTTTFLNQKQRQKQNPRLATASTPRFCTQSKKTGATITRSMIVKI
jgi:hypothetical protein